MAYTINRLRREPLVWFLFAGIMLFGLHALVSQGEGDTASRIIDIDRESLLRFMQLRARSFNEAGAAAMLEHMPPEDVSSTVDDMVREEAKYREALRLGLDKDDYVMRRRLAQSLDYLADGAGACHLGALTAGPTSMSGKARICCAGNVLVLRELTKRIASANSRASRRQANLLMSLSKACQ